MIKVNIIKNNEKLNNFNFNDYKKSNLWYQLRKNFNLVKLYEVNLFEYNAVVK